jgi:anti-anti-sigma regulatory factor
VLVAHKKDAVRGASRGYLDAVSARPYRDNGAPDDPGTFQNREAQVSAELPEAPPYLEVELSATGDTCRLTLRGVLCATSLSALEAQVDQLGCMPCEQVVVDMHQLTELDEVGAKVILGLYYYVVGKGGELRMTDCVENVRATLQAAADGVIPLGMEPMVAFNALQPAPVAPSSSLNAP